jgi:hypothetical protein
MLDLLIYIGVPSALVSAAFGLSVWLIQKKLNKQERARELREQNTEQLMLLTLQNTRAINVLATATAKAVQRIPDAHCNGDMTAALEQAAIIQKKEKEFLFDQGIKHIFGEL